MIVRIARVKVGNRQAPYAVKFETPVSPKERRGFGVYAPVKPLRSDTLKRKTVADVPRRKPGTLGLPVAP